MNQNTRSTLTNVGAGIALTAFYFGIVYVLWAWLQ